MKQVAFLRGVNVGGKNKVNMKELSITLSAEGFNNVSTYIQSGNIIFDETENPKERVEKIIAENFGINTKAIIRTSKDLDKIIKNCPYPEEKAYITLLSGEAEPFNPIDARGDEYTLSNDTIYICMNGPAHESKLQNAVFEKRTGLDATTRNIRTIKELANRSK